MTKNTTMLANEPQKASAHNDQPKQLVSNIKQQGEDLMSAPKSAAQIRRELGQRGEDAAAEFLQNLGQHIIARNWRCRFGEVDLITRDGDTIVFCEVKTRKSVRAGQPSEAVTLKKQRKYSQLAALWISRFQDQEDCAVRFDTVSILVTGPHRARLMLLKGAFQLVEAS